jgi:CD36 family
MQLQLMPPSPLRMLQHISMNTTHCPKCAPIFLHLSHSAPGCTSHILRPALLYYYTSAPTTVHSDATQFHPGVSAHDKLTVWVGDIFQAIELVANTTVELHGVQLLRFGLVRHSLRDACTHAPGRAQQSPSCPPPHTHPAVYCHPKKQGCTHQHTTCSDAQQ